MSEYAIQYQLWALWGQAGATIAIAGFAGATWWATRAVGKATGTYARLTAFSLFEYAVTRGRNEKASEDFYRILSALLKRELPEVWDELKGHLPSTKE